MNDDGSMARLPQLQEVARTHDLRMVSVADIIAYRLRTETFVCKVAEAKVPTAFGEFQMSVFENKLDGEHHLCLTMGNISADEPVLVRVQSQATLGDVFHAAGNAAGRQLRASLQMIREAGSGVLVYLRQEKQGAVLAQEIGGHVPGNPEAGKREGAELRLYGIGAQILKQLGAGRIRLITSHPRKIIGLQGFGLTITGQVPLATDCPDSESL